MKPSFITNGVTFDTRNAIQGYARFMQDSSRQNIQGFLANDRMFTAGSHLANALSNINIGRAEQQVDSDFVLAKHNNLKSRFDALVEKSGIQPSPRLIVIDYGIPIVACNPEEKTNDVIIDRSALKLLAPEEADGIIAHELGHIKLRHKSGTYAKDEFAADKYGGKLTGKPEMLGNAVAKLDGFMGELRKASPGFFIAEGTLRWASGTLSGIVGRGSSIHPNHSIRK